MEGCGDRKKMVEMKGEQSDSKTIAEEEKESETECKLCKTLHRNENQPITYHTHGDRQKHKNPHKHAPLIVTPRRNASITDCMAWRERGDRSHIGDGQQNAIPGSQLSGCVSVIPTALIILPHITLHCWNSHLSAYSAYTKWRWTQTHKYQHTHGQTHTWKPVCIHYCQGKYDVRG